MSTITFDLHADAIGTTHSHSKAPGTGLFARLMESRLHRGEAQLRQFLARKSDADLAALGFSDVQIRHIRATGTIPGSFWR